MTLFKPILENSRSFETCKNYVNAELNKNDTREALARCDVTSQVGIGELPYLEHIRTIVSGSVTGSCFSEQHRSA